MGHENFKELIDNQLDFVDKSLFIQEILEDKATKAAVITRPRRFGKTLNLSMLHHFLAAEVNGQSTKGLFDGLKIASLGDEYLRHQGCYPVIFLTFKSVKDGGFEHAPRKIAMLMAEYIRNMVIYYRARNWIKKTKCFTRLFGAEKRINRCGDGD